MATSFSIVLREAIKHLNAYKSGTAATVRDDYIVSPPTITEVVDPYFSLGFIQDKVTDAHGRLSLEIANVRAHPWRTWINNSVTGSLLTGAALPSVAANGKSIVGAWGQVLNGTTPMTEAAPERIAAYTRFGMSSSYNLPDLYYIDGGYIYHTAGVTGATINCCTYERSTVAALVASGGNILLPDVLVDAIVAGAVGECIIEDKGSGQAAYFLGAFEKAIESIRNGQTTMPMKLLTATA